MSQARTGTLLVAAWIGVASLLLWGIASSGSLPAGTVRLVHDFFPGEFEADRPLPQLTRLGKMLFFIASDLENGRRVWRTDGTAAGSHPVPLTGYSGTVENPRIAGRLGRVVLWTAFTADASRRVLFAATERGAGVALRTIDVRDTFSEPYWFLGRRLFFQDCAAQGCSIWSTDGTISATGPVRALAHRFTESGGILGTFADRWLILVSEGGLYAYDAELDRVVFLLHAGGVGSVQVYPVGETLFILTFHQRDGGRLWTKLWTSRLAAPRASQLFAASWIEVAGWRDGRLYFADEKGQLWSTDGRRENTRPYTGLRVDRYSVLADQLGGVRSTTLLPVPGYYGKSLLGLDENRREARELLRVCSGKYACLSTHMSAVTVAGGRAFEEITGFLWQSDGTARGTRLHRVLARTAASSFRVLDDRLLLGAVSYEGEEQLWETDGTIGGTRSLSDGTSDRPFRVYGSAEPFAGALYVAAERRPVGQQLWRVENGRATPVSNLRHLASGIEPYFAVPLGDRFVIGEGRSLSWVGLTENGAAEALPARSGVCFGFENPCPRAEVVLGRRLLFSPYERSELWITDATAAGTAKVVPPGEDGITLRIAALGPWGDRALIFSIDAGLWSSDGSPEGTRLIARLPAGPARSLPGQPVGPPVALGSMGFLFRRVLVPGDPALAALELWRTDGTAAGTLRLASLPFPQEFLPFPNPTILGGRLFFRFKGAIWVSDGTVAGTRELPDQPPGGTFALSAGAATLYVAAGDPGERQQSLWAIDPATLQASRLRTFHQLGGGVPGTPLGSAVGDALIFRARDDNGTEEWWVTQGTAASTHPVTESLPDNPIRGFVTAGDRRYFVGCDDEHGCELWSTDARVEDTRRVEDLWPGPRSSEPFLLAVSDDALWFAATEPTAGRELWQLDLAKSRGKSVSSIRRASGPVVLQTPMADGATHESAGGESRRVRRRTRPRL